MSVFAMPIIIMIEADSVEEAQKAIDDWGEEVELDNDLPVGTEDIDTEPQYELNDEGQRVLYLPALEECDEDGLDSDVGNDEDDDFNDGEDF